MLAPEMKQELEHFNDIGHLFSPDSPEQSLLALCNAYAAELEAVRAWEGCPVVGLDKLRAEILEELNYEFEGTEPYEYGYSDAMKQARKNVVAFFNTHPSVKPGTKEVTDQEFADAISEVPLSISSTRRGGENGLRNADEVYRALKRAGYRLVKRGAA